MGTCLSPACMQGERPISTASMDTNSRVPPPSRAAMLPHPTGAAKCRAVLVSPRYFIYCILMHSFKNPKNFTKGTFYFIFFIFLSKNSFYIKALTRSKQHQTINCANHCSLPQYLHISHLHRIVHPKMKILSLITLMLFQTRNSSSEHKLRYFWWNLRAFWPYIDSNATTTFKAQKGSKDIIKK